MDNYVKLVYVDIDGFVRDYKPLNQFECYEGAPEGHDCGPLVGCIEHRRKDGWKAIVFAGQVDLNLALRPGYSLIKYIDFGRADIRPSRLAEGFLMYTKDFDTQITSLDKEIKIQESERKAVDLQLRKDAAVKLGLQEHADKLTVEIDTELAKIEEVKNA